MTNYVFIKCLFFLEISKNMKITKTEFRHNRERRFMNVMFDRYSNIHKMTKDMPPNPKEICNFDKVGAINNQRFKIPYYDIIVHNSMQSR